jgi:hypothetical protein
VIFANVTRLTSDPISESLKKYTEVMTAYGQTGPNNPLSIADGGNLDKIMKSQLISYNETDEFEQEILRSTTLSGIKVYVSLTTSPKRLNNIASVLDTVNWNFIEKAFLALPEYYQNKAGESYRIPAELTKKYPKLQLLRTEIKDLGPAMKLVPAIEYLQSHGENNAIVITIDDDSAYPKENFRRLAVLAAKHRAVVGSSGQDVAFWQIENPQHKYWKTQGDFAPCFGGEGYKSIGLSACDVVEGFGGVAYPVYLVDTKLIREFISMDTSCKVSDDLVISWSLNQKDTTRLMVAGYTPDQFAYGFEEDALHRGGGLLGESVDHGVNINAKKYQTCFEKLKLP